jgi:hypothetical protein
MRTVELRAKPTVISRQVLTRLFLPLITAITLAAFSPAALAMIVATDYVNLNGGEADFGSGSHVLGGPIGNGVLTFDYDASSGQLVATGRVRGTLYWDSLFSSGCSRLTAKFRDGAANLLATKTVDLCGPGGDANNLANQKPVDVSFSSPNLNRVDIATATVSNGTATAKASTSLLTPNKRTYGGLDIQSFPPCSNSPFCSSLVEFSGGSATFTRSNGSMTGSVAGTLTDYANESCGRLFMDFFNQAGNDITTRTRDVCPSPTAPYPFTRSIADSFTSGSLFQIGLTVGELHNGTSFENEHFQDFNFNGPTGNFTLAPSDASAAVHERLNYLFTWTVPDPRNWHDLESLELRIRDGTHTVLLIDWDEATNTVSLFNQASGKFGPAFQPGSANVLQSAQATLYLADMTVQAVNGALGTGPTSPSVQLTLPLSFKPSAAGRTFIVEVAASDDLGHQDPFVQAGTLTVTE